MSAERYRVTEYQHSGLDFLQIERGGSTHELCAQTDDSMIVGAIRQQSADIDQLRARLASPAHAHLDGEHLNGMVDGCLLCQAITERDQLRAELAAAVAERDQLRAEMIEAQAQIARDDEHYAAAMAMAEKHRVEVCRLASRLAAIDSAPTAASIGIDVLGKPRALYFPPPHRSAFAAKIDAVGGWTIKELIARPAKD